jgi:FKBP-type peptidyl-prolyl cis-trans isomerase FkpA
MKKHIYSILILCAFAITATAQTGMQRTPKGALYTIFTHNTGDKIKLNDVITMQVVQKTGKDSVLFSSYTANHPVKLQVQPSQSLADMMEVFPLLALNDSALVKVPTDSIFKGHEESRPPFLTTGTFLNFYIKIVKIQSLNDAITERNAETAAVKTAEITNAAKYIADNKLIVKTTPSGLKYFITKTAIKPRPLNGDTVAVNYTGKLLNGQVFDSSVAADAAKAGLQQPGRTYEPIKFALGEGKVIKGWDEGLLLLREGEKATFIIPSSLAYGEQASGPIPPFSTLIFNVELVSVKRIPHAFPTKKPLVTTHHPLTKKKR